MSTVLYSDTVCLCCSYLTQRSECAAPDRLRCWRIQHVGSRERNPFNLGFARNWTEAFLPLCLPPPECMLAPRQARRRV